MLPEVGVCVEALIRPVDPQQLLFLRPQGIEDRLAILFGVKVDTPGPGQCPYRWAPAYSAAGAPVIMAAAIASL